MNTVTTLEAQREYDDFANEAIAYFKKHPQCTTYIVKRIDEDCLFAVRNGTAADCIFVMRIAEEFIVKYQQTLN